MHLIRHPLHEVRAGRRVVDLVASRQLLAKTRWRASAADGEDFGFDLEQPLRHGDLIHLAADTAYQIRQEEEPVLELDLGRDIERAAFVAWSLGNLHQSVEIRSGRLRVVDEPAVRLALDQMRIAYQPARAVFLPVRAAHSHLHDAPT